MVIVQHFPGSVKEYIAAVEERRKVFALPECCPHPDCRAVGVLIRWGSYQRWVCLKDAEYRLAIQRIRCKDCGRTHSLLPDFVHPHRLYSIGLQHDIVSQYLLGGLGWQRLMRELPEQGPARSTVREWIASFAYGAGELLLDWLRRQLLSLTPLAELPTEPAPQLLERAHSFWLLAEQLYTQVKVRLPRLHFAQRQLFPFLLHWLQHQGLPPRLFWSPALPNTPSTPF